MALNDAKIKSQVMCSTINLIGSGLCAITAALFAIVLAYMITDAHAWDSSLAVASFVCLCFAAVCSALACAVSYLIIKIS